MSSRSEATLTLDLADGNPYPLGLRIRATTCSAHHCETTVSWWVMISTYCVLRICDTCSIQSSRMDNVSTQWGCIWIMHNSVLFHAMVRAYTNVLTGLKAPNTWERMVTDRWVCHETRYDFTSLKNLSHSTSVSIQSVLKRVSTEKGQFPFQITNINKFNVTNLGPDSVSLVVS